MKFKPVTQNYVFTAEVLIKSYPDYLRTPIAQWIQEVLRDAQLWQYKGGIYGGTEMSEKFLNNLNLHFRENFPRKLGEFINFVFKSDDRITNILALCLQNYATNPQANQLDQILTVGGSGYSVMLTADKPGYGRGVADLTERVPEIMQVSSGEVLNTEPQIKEAWVSCYSRNPDYEKTVGRCVDALEGILKKNYFPKDPKPTLGRFIKNLHENPEKLNYIGDNLPQQKNLVTDLAENFIRIRGHHTNGDGRAPTKEEAEFVLHYTIFVFSLHNR